MATLKAKTSTATAAKNRRVDLEMKIDFITEQMYKGFDEANGKLSSIDTRLNTINNKVDTIDEKFGIIGNTLQKIEKKLPSSGPDS